MNGLRNQIRTGAAIAATVAGLMLCVTPACAAPNDTVLENDGEYQRWKIERRNLAGSVTVLCNALPGSKPGIVIQKRSFMILDGILVISQGIGL